MMVESEGRFNMDELDTIEEKAKIICFGDLDAKAEDDEGGMNLHERMKHAMQERVRRNERWKEG